MSATSPRNRGAFSLRAVQWMADPQREVRISSQPENPKQWFRKHYTCPCGTEWWDEWDCLCNDRCPTCNAEIELDDYEELTP